MKNILLILITTFLSVQSFAQVDLSPNADGSFTARIKGKESKAVPEYSTGTWTPSQGAGVSNFSGTAAFGAATYTKIGKMVFANIFSITGLVSTTSGATCTYAINTTGLPGINNTTQFYGSAYTLSTNGPVTAAVTDLSSANTVVGVLWDANASAASVTIASIGFWYIAE
jgi:hypothetical protein